MRVKPWIPGIEPYKPGKPIEELERELGIKEAVKLASNENPLGPSPKALAAVAAAAARVHRYPDGGSFKLRAALAKRLGVQPAQLVFGTGADEIFELLVKCFVGPGDEVVYPWPSFAMYPVVTQGMGGTAVPVPLDAGLVHDLPALCAAVTPRTRLVLVCNPNNPTGTSVGREAFDRFVAALPAHVVLAVDEAYADYARRADFPDSIGWLARRPGTAVIRTFSKIYGLAGLRVGYCAADPELASYLERARHPFNLNLLAEAGACAALDDAEHVARTRRVNAEGLEYLTQELRALGVETWPSDANFVLAKPGPGAYEALLAPGRDRATAQRLRHARARAHHGGHRRGERALHQGPAAVAGLAMSAHFERVAVVGVGLLGGSIAAGARQRGLAREVVGVVRSERAASEIVALGLADRAERDLARGVTGADLVILASPVHAMPELVRRAAPALAPAAIVTDVGSVKAPLAETLPALLPPGATYVGSHPMAGSHHTGYRHARADLCEGAACVVTPALPANPAAEERVGWFWRALGARVVRRSAARHDEEVAWVSHAPHAIAFAFAASLAEAPAGARELAGPGFRDFTRIAASDPALWADLLAANRRALAAPLLATAERFTALARAIEAGDAGALERLLAAARSQLATEEISARSGGANPEIQAARGTAATKE